MEKRRGFHADAGYVGVQKREEFEGNKIDWLVAEKKGRLKAMAEEFRKDLLREWEHRKAQVRSQVEHPCHMIKNLFGYGKVRYWGLGKISPNFTASSPWPIWSLPDACSGRLKWHESIGNTLL